MKLKESQKRTDEQLNRTDEQLCRTDKQLQKTIKKLDDIGFRERKTSYPCRNAEWRRNDIP